MASGSVDGGKILGSFPSDMTNEGDLVFNGVVIPTKPWEAVWNGVAQWFGIETDDDLRTILPNRDTFLNDLWTESDLFTTLPKTTPSVSPNYLRIKLTTHNLPVGFKGSCIVTSGCTDCHRVN